MWNLLSRHVWQYTTFLALNTCRALYIFLPQMSHICSSKCFRSNSISSLISCLSFFFFVSSSLLEVVMIVSNDANTHLPPMSIVKTESAEVIEAAKKSPRKTKARKSWKSEASTAASNSKSRTKTTSARQIRHRNRSLSSLYLYQILLQSRHMQTLVLLLLLSLCLLPILLPLLVCSVTLSSSYLIS